MPTVRTAKHLLLESTTKSVESRTYDVICQFRTVKGMVVESEVLKAQNCALSKLSLPMHSDVEAKLKPRIDVDTMFSLKLHKVLGYIFADFLRGSDCFSSLIYISDSRPNTESMVW